MTKVFKKPVWKLWYQGCWTQQVYIVFTILVGLMTSIGLITFLTSSPKVSDSDTSKLLHKYKTEIAIFLVSSFLIAFAVDNLILTFYCNQGFDGGKNLLLTLVLYFIVLSVVNYIIASILESILLKNFTKELKTLAAVAQK